MSIRKRPFTLLELTAAMGVLIIFMLFVMRFFSTSQDVMNRSSGKTDQYERARVVMDMLSTDLQNIFYTEGVDASIFYQKDTGLGDAKYTETLSLFVLRPSTQELTDTADTETKTDLAAVKYKFDTDDYTLKMGVAEDKVWRAWETVKGTVKNYPDPNDLIADSDMGVLAEGVYKFRIVPLTRDGTELTPSTTAGKPDGFFSDPARRIPDSVRIELQMLDGETAEAIKAIKALPGGTLPNTLDPSNDAFTGKDKVRTFFRILEIDRGQ